MIDSLSGRLLKWGKPTARGIRFAASVQVPASAPTIWADNDPIGRMELTRDDDGVIYRLSLVDIPRAREIAALAKGGVQLFAEPKIDGRTSDGWAKRGKIERVHLWPLAMGGG